jgi:hypothetical protein
MHILSREHDLHIITVLQRSVVLEEQNMSEGKAKIEDKNGAPPPPYP